MKKTKKDDDSPVLSSSATSVDPPEPFFWIASELPTIRELAGSVKECRDARHVWSIRSEERYCHNAVITLLA